MSDEEIPLSERVASYYSQLSSVAADLNAVSDELGKSIGEIDAALKKLNLGIATWVTISSGNGNRYHEDYSYWSRDIGYAKVGGKWGISLRKVDGDYQAPDEETVEAWPFNEAPRSIRLEAIDKIPTLIETLSRDAIETTKKIRARLGEAKEVAEAIKGAGNRPAQTPPRTPYIDLTRVTKPGDVIKAVLDKKQREQAAAPEAVAAPALGALDLDSLRHSAVLAMRNAGHGSAAELLNTGSWAVDGSGLRIEVPGIGKKMLALTVNAAAEKVIRTELQRLGAPSRFLVVPEAKPGPNDKPVSASDSLRDSATEVK